MQSRFKIFMLFTAKCLGNFVTCTDENFRFRWTVFASTCYELVDSRSDHMVHMPVQ